MGCARGLLSVGESGSGGRGVRCHAAPSYSCSQVAGPAWLHFAVQSAGRLAKGRRNEAGPEVVAGHLLGAAPLHE